MQENQISHMFLTFLLQTEEDMASCSRTFPKPKSADEERNLIENAILKSTLAVIKWSAKICLEWQNFTKNKNPAIESTHIEICTHHLLCQLSVDN